MESVPNAATQKGEIRVTARKPATTPLSSKRLRNIGTHICDANGDIGVFSPHHNEPRVYQRAASNRLTPSGGRSIPIGYLIQRDAKRGLEAGRPVIATAAQINVRSNVCYCGAKRTPCAHCEFGRSRPIGDFVWRFYGAIFA